MNKPMKKWLFFLHPRYGLLFCFFVHDFAFLSAVNAGIVISFGTACESLFWLLEKKRTSPGIPTSIHSAMVLTVKPFRCHLNHPGPESCDDFFRCKILRCWALVGLQPRMRVWKSLALEFQDHPPQTCDSVGFFHVFIGWIAYCHAMPSEFGVPCIGNFHFHHIKIQSAAIDRIANIRILWNLVYSIHVSLCRQR